MVHLAWRGAPLAVTSWEKARGQTWKEHQKIPTFISWRMIHERSPDYKVWKVSEEIGSTVKLLFTNGKLGSLWDVYDDVRQAMNKRTRFV
jgi:hypothetical protein